MLSSTDLSLRGYVNPHLLAPFWSPAIGSRNLTERNMHCQSLQCLCTCLLVKGLVELELCGHALEGGGRDELPLAAPEVRHLLGRCRDGGCLLDHKAVERCGDNQILCHIVHRYIALFDFFLWLKHCHSTCFWRQLYYITINLKGTLISSYRKILWKIPLSDTLVQCPAVSPYSGGTVPFY